MLVLQKIILTLCAIAPSQPLALKLNTPVAGTGFSGILSNGPATVSWTSGPGDPPLVTFEIQNNLTLDSYEFATAVDVRLGSITRNLSDVSGNEFYFMQAVDIANVTHVYASSPTFVVAGIAVTTTNPISFVLPASSTQLSSDSSPSTPAATSTVTTSSPTIPISGTNNSQTPEIPAKEIPIGGIVGGVVGGLSFLCVVAGLAAFLYRRRRHPEEPTISPLIIDESYVPPPTKGARLETILHEKAEAQKRRDRLQQDLETNHHTEREDGNGREAQLEHQVQVMSERIMELEEQQRELESYGLPNDLPPPEYAVAVPHVT